MSNVISGALPEDKPLKGDLAMVFGKDGENGKSAYEIAVEKGFKGTEEEWLESLKWKPQSGSVTRDLLDRDYWQMLTRVPVLAYDSLDSIIEEADSLNSIYRIELSVLSPIRKVVGEGSFVAIVRGDKSGLYLLNTLNGEGWTYKAGSNKLISPDREKFKSGAEVTLTLDQVSALDKMFEMAAYKDEAVAEVYKGFVSAFGLDKYRIMRTLESGSFISAGLSQYFNPYTYRTDWRQGGATIGEDGVPLADGVPYTYVNTSDSQNRTVYPYYDIPAEGGYSYQIYFEANEGVQVALEFYNQNVLDAVAESGNWDKADLKDGYGWQDSMEVNPDWSWVPPTEINGSPVKAMRLNFNSGDAGIKKVIIYRKKVTEDADS